MSYLHLAVALDGAGWHPAAWRDPSSRAEELFTGRYWADLVTEAERGLLDFVTFEDALAPATGESLTGDRRAGIARGRLDAILLATRVAPITSHIGLVAATDVTHSEPFHISTGIASLDYASLGRAGWRPRVSPRPDHAARFGRRTLPGLTREDFRDLAASPAAVELFAEASDAIEVVRRLWDSWEDDAEIRDVATSRFLDRDKLHYIDFDGPQFSVRGPSITPRPPQGQPLVTVLAHAHLPYELAVRGADVVYVTPRSRSHLDAILTEIATIREANGRNGLEPIRVFADLLVFLDDEPGAAAQRKTRLDEIDGTPLSSDAAVFAGTPSELADLLVNWRLAGLDGFRLRPGMLPHDLTTITSALVPELQRRGAFRESYEADTLRGLLRLPRPENRYATN